MSELGCLQSLAALRTTKRRAHVSRLIVETLYSDKEPSTARTRTLSAWSIAVRYLMEKAVLPSTIPELALVKGEGIDAWAKAGAKRTLSPTGRHQIKKNQASRGSNGDDQSWIAEKDVLHQRLYLIEAGVADLERLARSHPVKE